MAQMTRGLADSENYAAQIQEAFLREAQAAPTLFTDLAKVELYIAESYRTRAFIELLQNADDAGAKRFHISMHGNQVIVANDGRPFASSDVEALCRSGASNKRRGTGTIGYRGIGFKSVVGIASEIDVVSGAHAFRFSRKLTREILGADYDVPLIRVPHPIDSSSPAVMLGHQVIATHSLSTVFILSGLDIRALANDVEEFTDEALLFLSTVNEVTVNLPGVSRDLRRSAHNDANGCTIERLVDGQKESSWLIAAREQGCEKLAFLLDGDTVIPTPRSKALIHSFLPTSEFSGALLKMNGDFSTDPSRKSVDMDALSSTAFGACAQILAQLLEKALLGDTFNGIFSALPVDGASDERFRKLLRDSLIARFDDEGFPVSRDRHAKLSEIRLAPDWLSYDECELLCSNQIPALPSSWVSAHAHLPEVLRWLGVRSLTIQEGLGLTMLSEPTPAICAKLLNRAAKQLRYEMTEELTAWLASMPVLPLAAGYQVAPIDYRDEELSKEFSAFLAQIPDTDDLAFLLRKLKLPDKLLGPKAKQLSETKAIATAVGTPTSPLSGPSGAFRATPSIEKWRSAEKNAAAWFSALNDVLNVKDVSQANVGYDLEVLFLDGTRNYVEVKSVKRIGDPIRITNNEHSTAYQLGEAYVMAVVVNGDPFEIWLIRDPIRNMSLDKRCEQWNWYGTDYTDVATQPFEMR